MPEPEHVMLMLHDHVPDEELRDVLDALLDHLSLSAYREPTPSEYRPAHYTFRKKD